MSLSTSDTLRLPNYWRNSRAIARADSEQFSPSYQGVQGKMAEACLMLKIDHYESFAPGSSRLLYVRRNDQGDCYGADASSGPWRSLPDACGEPVGDWVKVMASDSITRLLNEYSAKCQHEQWTPHPDSLTVALWVQEQSRLHWTGDCGCNILHGHVVLPEGIISDYIRAMWSMGDGSCPPPVPAVYLDRPDLITYTGEGKGHRAALAELLVKSDLGVWAEHQHDWWTFPDVAGSTSLLGGFLKTLADHDVKWRDVLCPEELTAAEAALRSHGLLG
jgi:hypothetical protein